MHQIFQILMLVLLSKINLKQNYYTSKRIPFQIKLTPYRLYYYYYYYYVKPTYITQTSYIIYGINNVCFSFLSEIKMHEIIILN